MDLAELSIPSANPFVVNAQPLAIEAPTQPRVRRFGSSARWSLTIAATAASTLALEAIAAAGGFLLVASHVLDGAHRSVVLAFLAATYVVWAAGLRVNLEANWRLLDETGTSTNALSKMGFDLARLRSCSQRAVRVASAVGYVVTEIAKEAPYYAGAFGTALVSSSVDAKDALIFLGGANLGAAVYEYGVARLVRRRPRRTIAAHRATAPVEVRRDICLVRHRLETARVSERLLPSRRARRAGDHRVLRRRAARCRTGSTGPAVRGRADLAPRVPRRGNGQRDPPRRIPPDEPSRDRAMVGGRCRRARLEPIRDVHTGVRGCRLPNSGRHP